MKDIVNIDIYPFDKGSGLVRISKINSDKRKYEFAIHRKADITNVQIKPNSCHADKVKYGIFKGFLHRAHSICSEQCLEDELEFLISR